MAGIFWVMNAAFPTTAAPVKMATGTSIKTLLQVATPSHDLHPGDRVGYFL